MAIRWITGPLHAIKRGMTSLFVCAVVLLPLILVGIQIKGFVSPNDPRSDKALTAMQVRSIDRGSAPLKPFDEPLISVTFDDGDETVYTLSMPLLQKYGIPTTQYVLSGVEKDTNYLSFNQIKAIKAAGHEIACHSIDHPDLTTLSASGLTTQLTGCKTSLEKLIGSPVKEFAAPYGSNNDQTIAAIKQNFRSSRNTDGDIVTNVADDQDINTRANFRRYDIVAVTLRSDTSVAQLQAAIDYAVKNNGWLVLNYHQIDDEGNSQFALSDKLLEDQLRAISKAPARIVTMGQALDALEK